jgi:membrane associated rhomboid family serine protease
MALQQDIRTQWHTGGTLVRLIMLNIGVFLVLRLVDLAFFLFGAEGPDLVRWLMSTSDPALLLRTPWTPITYMFAHWDLFHLFFNMLVLWFIGRMFEDLLGGKRLLGNYLLGGLSGLLLYILSYNFLPAFERFAQGSTILGASGAVMAVFVGLATYRPDLQVHLLLFGAIRLKWLALIYVAIDLISIRQGGNSGGHIAHLGGALYGFLASQQLSKGRDWSLSLANALDRVSGLFARNSGGRMRVAKHPGARNAGQASVPRNAAREAQARIDAILDKISRSGYDSLSKEEKDLLFKASK